jgi:hypothetical protein
MSKVTIIGAGQSNFVEVGRRGDCLAIPARLVEGELVLGGALGGVEGCSHLGDRAPAKRERDVLLELASKSSIRLEYLLGWLRSAEATVTEVGLAWKSEIVNAAQVSTWLAGVRLLPKKEFPAEAELAVNEHGQEVRSGRDRLTGRRAVRCDTYCASMNPLSPHSGLYFMPACAACRLLLCLPTLPASCLLARPAKWKRAWLSRVSIKNEAHGACRAAHGGRARVR